MSILRSLKFSQKGQGMVEYALALVLIAIAALTMVRSLGWNLQDKYQYVDDSLAAACPAGSCA